MKKKYNGKVLLFGEYSVIHGSHALAVPTDLFSGEWDYDEEQAKVQAKILRSFHGYLSNLDFGDVSFDATTFVEKLDHHLYFRANIPIGYGVGSSGAVTAAIFDQFFQKDNQLSISRLKDILGRMEGFFHGTSSGLDPLICYLNQAVLVQQNEVNLVETSLQNEDYTFFLLDTGFPRRTEALVKKYLSTYETNEAFRKMIHESLSVLNNQAISQVLKKKTKDLFKIFHDISQVQETHFQEMIPIGIKKIWQEGLEGKLYKLKLCGAGGGGFMLGITQNFEETQAELKDFDILAL